MQFPVTPLNDRFKVGYEKNSRSNCILYDEYRKTKPVVLHRIKR